MTSDEKLSGFEIAMLTAFNQPCAETYAAVNGSGRRDLRKAAIERLVALGLLCEEAPYAFRITHRGHTLLHENSV